MQTAATSWLAWYDGLFSEPAAAAADAWDATRLEYGLSVSARLSATPTDEFTFTATEVDDGRLDWTAFDLDGEVNLGTAGDQAWTSLVETTVPAPVTFRGGPAPRFWEMEDARLAYGLVAVGPTDLVQLMMIEYASSYGNDWFVVPLTLPVGSVTRVASLVVTDAFGVKMLLRPIGDPALPAANWSMWQHAFIRRAGEDRVPRPATNLFFLPPSAARGLEGPALEDVLFMRDEMANLAWAIERRIESPIEQATRREALLAATATPAPDDIASGNASASAAGLRRVAALSAGVHGAGQLGAADADPDARRRRQRRLAAAARRRAATRRLRGAAPGARPRAERRQPCSTSTTRRCRAKA